MLFPNRTEAGEQLAEILKNRLPSEEPVLYALPRGGVICAVPIARVLHIPLDLLLTRKIGHPNNPEYAIGAIAEDSEPLLSEEAVNLPAAWISSAIQKERREIQRRRKTYLGGSPPLSAKNKVAIIVDDGLATGFTMQAAIFYLKEYLHPKQIIIAIPVAPEGEIRKIESTVDAAVVLHRETDSSGFIGQYYASFPQVTDEEVKECLKQPSL